MKRNDDTVSVVCVSYRTGASLWPAIESILSQPGLGELLLVDNGNPREIRATLARRNESDARLRVISGHGNIGFAAGCNLGAHRATAKYLMFVNPDCVLPEHGLRQFVAVARQSPRPFLLGCRLINADGSEQRGSRRALLTPTLALREMLPLYRLGGRFRRWGQVNLLGEPVPADVAPMPVVSGACMFLRADDFRELGGFDEGYFLHVEDLDLCLRVNRAGGTVYFLPHVCVTHERSTSQASRLGIEWHKTRSFIRYFHKNFPDRHLLPLLWICDLAAILRYLARAAAATAGRSVRGFR